MAEYDIIGGIVSPKAQKEMDAYYDSILKIAEAIKNMPTLGGAAAPTTKGGGGGSKPTAEFDALTEANKRLTKSVQELEIAQQKITAQTAKNITSRQALSQVQKLNATLASAETSELQKMDAQMKLISLDLQKMVVAKQTETKAYTDGIAKLKNMSVEYDRLSKASGASMMKTKSMYGSTFQLTQVMRELPNFAIDARVGFMALSNNLPMLADGFSQLKNEIDATTGKAYGFSGAAKIFAKSLLSLNTIMIVASTLLVLFGDDMIDFVGKLFKGDEVVNRLRESTKSLIEVMQDYSGQAAKSIGNIQKMGVELEKYGDNVDYAKIIVDKFNATFNTHLKAINEVKKAYPEMAKAAIDAAVKLQASARIIDMGARGTLMSMEAESNLARKPKSKVEEQKARYNELVALFESQKADMNKFTTDLVEGNSPYATFFSQNIMKLGDMNEKLAQFYEKDGNLWYAQQFAKLQKGKKLAKLAEIELAPLLTPPIATTTTTPETEKETKDKGSKVPYIFPKSIVGDIKKLKEIKFPKLEDPFNAQMAAIDKVLTYSIDQYTKGNLTFAELEKVKTDLYKEAEDANVVITDENQQKIIDIEKEAFKKRENAILDLKDIQSKAALETVDNLMAIWQVYFDYMAQLVDKQLEKDTEINDERVQQYKDETDSGMHSKQELSDFEDRVKAYQKSQDEQAAADKAKLERNSFLVGQAFAIADIWLKYSQTEAAIALAAAVIAATPIIGLVAAPAYAATASALNLATAISGTALAAAQSIPYFAEGGVMDREGKAVLGDGGKRELAISPSGNFFISKDTPTMYNLEKGTQILPDVNKVDLMGILALKQVMPLSNKDDRTEALLQSIDKSIKSQKQGNFYGMPLIKQLDSRSRYSSRSRSLMN